MLDRQEQIERLSVRCCERYAAAFNAANKTSESGSVQVELKDIVSEALMQAEQGIWELAAQVTRLIGVCNCETRHTLRCPMHLLAEEFLCRARPGASDG